MHTDLALLAELARQLHAVEDKLDAVAKTDTRTTRLRTIPGVGPRLSAAVVAWIDDPTRFRNARAVGSYVGLVPRRRQSGTYDRSGRVTKQGPGLLRKLLVEVAWIMRQHNPHAEVLFRKLSKGQKSRHKQAMVALARRGYEAKVLIERWRVQYNTVRPHSSLGYRPPAPKAWLVEKPDSASLHPALLPRNTPWVSIKLGIKRGGWVNPWIKIVRRGSSLARRGNHRVKLMSVKPKALRE